MFKRIVAAVVFVLLVLALGELRRLIHNDPDMPTLHIGAFYEN
jgi:hypothetical protein